VLVVLPTVASELADAMKFVQLPQDAAEPDVTAGDVFAPNSSMPSY
jgi:hypothetical protein